MWAWYMWSFSFLQTFWSDSKYFCCLPGCGVVIFCNPLCWKIAFLMSLLCKGLSSTSQFCLFYDPSPAPLGTFLIQELLPILSWAPQPPAVPSQLWLSVFPFSLAYRTLHRVSLCSTIYLNKCHNLFHYFKVFIAGGISVIAKLPLFLEPSVVGWIISLYQQRMRIIILGTCEYVCNSRGKIQGEVPLKLRSVKGRDKV